MKVSVFSRTTSFAWPKFIWWRQSFRTSNPKQVKTTTLFFRILCKFEPAKSNQSFPFSLKRLTIFYSFHFTDFCFESEGKWSHLSKQMFWRERLLCWQAEDQESGLKFLFNWANMEPPLLSWADVRAFLILLFQFSTLLASL